MIANISPSMLHFEETHNTLKYASRAKQIKMKVEKNSIKVEHHVREYLRIIETLQREVEELRATSIPPSATIIPRNDASGNVQPIRPSTASNDSPNPPQTKQLPDTETKKQVMENLFEQLHICRLNAQHLTTTQLSHATLLRFLKIQNGVDETPLLSAAFKRHQETARLLDDALNVEAEIVGKIDSLLQVADKNVGIHGTKPMDLEFHRTILQLKYGLLEKSNECEMMELRYENLLQFLLQHEDLTHGSFLDGMASHLEKEAGGKISNSIPTDSTALDSRLLDCADRNTQSGTLLFSHLQSCCARRITGGNSGIHCSARRCRIERRAKIKH